jgi:hypothetical protein
LIDGAYRSKLGNLVLARADTVVWLDLPRRVWLPRLLRRTIRRLLMQEQLWNGNRETLHGVPRAPDALIPIAWRSFAARRHRYPTDLASYPVVRLRSRRAVAQFLATARRDEGHVAGRHHATRARIGIATISSRPSGPWRATRALSLSSNSRAR